MGGCFASLLNGFDGFMHNSTMELVCFDLVVWKPKDFALAPDNIALCYELSFVSYKAGLLCWSCHDLPVCFCK